MGIRIEIKGIEEVQKFLKNANAEKLQKAQEGLNQAGLFIQGEIVESIAGHRAEPRSVDTGRFMGSIKKVDIAPLIIGVETNVEYAKFLEYGTSKMEPRMHFRNTLTREEKKVVGYLKEKIKS